MHHNGLKLALIGLILGVLIGLGIRALKAIVAQELVSMLQDEVAASCACKFRHDGVSVSLLTLKASAKNPRIEADGQPKLAFKTIRAHFSLRQLGDHIIPLTNLELIRGRADGIGPDSAVFKFIDHLAAPIAPERDYPGRWKIKLLRLSVTKSTFNEPVPLGELRGDGVELDMRRTPDDNFNLKPVVAQLHLVTPSQEINLGRATSEIILTDDFASYQPATLNSGASTAMVKGRSLSKQGDMLEGELTYNLRPATTALEAYIDGGLTGTAVLAGSLGHPSFTGNLTSDGPLTFKPLDNQLQFQSLAGNLSFAYPKSGETQATLSLRGDGSSCRIHTTTPVTLKSSNLSGSIELQVDSLELGGLAEAQNVTTQFGISGTVRKPLIDIRSTIGQLGVGLARLNDVRFSAIPSDDGTGWTLQLTQGQGLEGKGSITRSTTNAGSATIDPSPATIEASFEAKDLAIFGERRPLRLTGTAGLHGPLTLDGLIGSSEFTLNQTRGNASLTLGGKAALKDGKVALTAANNDQAINLSLAADLTGKSQSELKVVVQSPLGTLLGTEDPCSAIDLGAEYNFNSNKSKSGSGKINLRTVGIGCDPYRLALGAPTSIPIENGVIKLEDLSLRGTDSSFTIAGAIDLVRGFNLSTQGAVELASIVGLTRRLDDLRGKLKLQAAITGPLSAPEASGQVTVNDGEFTLESSGLVGQGITADLALIGQELVIRRCTGTVNDGTISLSGRLFPLNLNSSEITLTAHDVLFEPTTDANVALSANLKFTQLTSGQPGINGEIELESGEFEKNFNILNIIQVIGEYIFSARRTSAELATLPTIGLDVRLFANRNLFLFTNWLGAELRADLRVTGDLSNPGITGDMETLSGWFGLRERRFDITSGKMDFRTGAAEPELELIGESTIRSYAGDNILVVLEATGPLTSPKIKLSSDSGLTQKEILALLTASGGLQNTTQINQRPDDMRLGELTLAEPDTPTLEKFLRNVTTIDSLAIEPAFNVQRGVIEPTLIGRKNITKNFALIGESFIGSTSTESQVRASYSLTPYLNVVGSVASVSNKQNALLGADVIYTVLSSQDDFLKISISGNKSLDDGEVLNGLRINRASRVLPTDTDRLARSLVRTYHRGGFFDATAEVQCAKPERYCRELLVTIEEGQLNRISDIILVGDPLPAEIKAAPFTRHSSNQIASQDFADDLLARLTRKLRSEGYIASRVKTIYQPSGQPNERQLEVSVVLGRPVTFYFTGNKLFSAADFLETINLFKRKQPFGNNTINILLENIERKYREAGYLFVALSQTDQIDPITNRLTYHISVEEGDRAAVISTTLDGLNEVTEDQIKDKLAELHRDRVKFIFSPKAAVAEELEINSRLLAETLQELGFPETSVTYRIEPEVEGPGVAIRYLIIEGEKLLFTSVDLRGWPADLPAPALEAGPYPILDINRYTTALLDSLRDHGYLSPALNTNFGGDKLSIEVLPGTQTHFGAISIEGAQSVERQVIQRNIRFQEGQPWDQAAIDETRRRLLRLGLFGRIEILAADGALDSPQEDVVVSVSERPLQTLDIGSGLNSEYGVHIFAEANDRSLFRDGRSISLRVDSYYDSAQAAISQGVASLKYTDPYFLDSPWSLTEDLRYQKVDLSTQEYNLDRSSLASYLYRSSEQGFTYSFGHTFLNETLTDVSPGAVLSDLDTGSLNISFLSGVVTFDKRDDPLNPTSGFSASLDSMLAAEGLGSDANYYSFGGRASFLMPLPFGDRRFSLAANGHAAEAWTYSGTSEVPITQRYYLGGRNTVRGFRENSLGPKGVDDAVIGGDILLQQNAELRYLLTNTLSTHFFFDAGNVFLKRDSPDLYDLRTSSGFGIRYLSPLGPIGVDLGHPLDRKSGEANWRLHFNIGTNF